MRKSDRDSFFFSFLLLRPSPSLALHPVSFSPNDGRFIFSDFYTHTSTHSVIPFPPFLFGRLIAPKRGSFHWFTLSFVFFLSCWLYHSTLLGQTEFHHQHHHCSGHRLKRHPKVSRRQQANTAGQQQLALAVPVAPLSIYLPATGGFHFQLNTNYPFQWTKCWARAPFGHTHTHTNNGVNRQKHKFFHSLSCACFLLI